MSRHLAVNPNHASSCTRRAWGGTDVCVHAVCGFTLVETLVTIVVLGTLLSILFNSMTSAKSTARQAACAINMRNATLLHLVHAASDRDRFVNAGPDVHFAQSPTLEMLRVGGTRGLPNGSWAIEFPDDWTGDRFSKGLRCPRDPAWAVGVPGQASSYPAFWMSMALWLDPACLRAPTPPDTFRWRENRVGDVLSPSKKVLLYEQVAYCISDPRALDDIQNSNTPRWPSSVGFVDGSVRRMPRASGLPGYYYLPFLATVNGIEGVDVP
jgi:prepilin-type N-terminal cleavage/methylation domain-containing protein